MADDWDLQAVVRGCTAATSSSAVSDSCSGEDQFMYFQDPIGENFSPDFEDLSDLFKPFFPKSPLSVLHGLQELSPAPAPEIRVKQSSRGSSNPRSKRRRNQMKRVCQVPAEGLSSDIWSWRKYGQKPIKGSPYPRGYYRCSTLKGCLARKHVERNRSDPGMFIVTYTGEHTHPIPTHRNSLAGLTRSNNKSSTVTEDSVTAGDHSNASPVSERAEESFEDEVISDDFFEGLEELECAGAGDLFSDHFP